VCYLCIVGRFFAWWDFGAIDSAEADSDNSMDFSLLPLAEYTLPENTGMKSVIDCGTRGNQRSFIIVDSYGTASNISFVWKGENTFILAVSLNTNSERGAISLGMKYS
jgi:hypothetical protein